MMANLLARSYAGDRDLSAIADLINTCEAVDKLDEGTSISQLQEEFDAPSLDKTRDLCLWEDASGKLIAFAQLSVSELGEVGKVTDGWLWFHVRPDVRGGEVEATAIAWGEARMCQVAKERGTRVKFRSYVRAEDGDRISLLVNSGFQADRYFFRMARSLAEPIPEPQFPEGFLLREFPGEEHSEAWVEMFNQSFIDHWNHHDLTVEEFKYDLAKPYYRQDLDLIAVAAEGTFVAFCYCEINPEENDRTGRNEGWIGVLGTRRGFRKIGLGRAMLLAGLQRLKAAGVGTAILGVDAENPWGALRLYESTGFHKIRNSISYVKDVRSI
ncbi:MAG: GNAT family N-acetyltransferase [Oscillatoriaceae cyanobacterium Prado104]|jgi:mycothiol synthase|nr:GNAT family N-acetyltransferase [Oscillatoriaceae cyanobacterium Prado104]